MFLRSAPLRLKLIAALLLPLLVVAGFLAFGVNQALDQRGLAARQSDEVSRFEAATAFAQAIDTEAIAINDGSQDSDDLAQRRNDVDNAIIVLRDPSLGIDAVTVQTMNGIYTTLGDVRGRLGSDVDQIRQELQRQVTAGNQGQPETVVGDLLLIGGLSREVLAGFNFNADAVADAETVQKLSDYALVQRLRSNYSQETRNTLGVLPLPAEAMTPFVTEFFSNTQAATDQALEVLTELGSSDMVAEVEGFLQSDGYMIFGDIRSTLNGIEVNQAPTGIDPQATQESGGLVNATLQGIADDVVDDVNAQAGDTLDDATYQLLLITLFGGLLLAVVTMILVVLYRSIRTPLTDLTARSTEIATVELPEIVTAMRRGEIEEMPSIEPLAAESNDEIGDLVHAFNGMHHTAVELATEQAASRRVIADMFVNLGRRNQRLLNRLLKGLTTLERSEEDPDSLEALYLVDHLATRMRRNAESLLILAGASQARRFNHSVDIHDVVRAALAEVEGYERVQIENSAEILVRGDYVADLTHLLAELIENALSFSPPDESVEIVARATQRGVVIGVSDQGIGMTPELLEVANSRIRSAADHEESPSEFLGHFVVGRLAARHNVDVELFEGLLGGITARIILPAEAIDSVPTSPTQIQAEVEQAADDAIDASQPAFQPSAEWDRMSAVTETSDRPLVSPSPLRSPVPASEPARIADAGVVIIEHPIDEIPVQEIQTAVESKPAEVLTTFGSSRRTPGSSLPDTSLKVSTTDHAPSVWTPDEDDPQSLRSSLSGFQSGTQRADIED